MSPSAEEEAAVREKSERVKGFCINPFDSGALGSYEYVAIPDDFFCLGPTSHFQVELHSLRDN